MIFITGQGSEDTHTINGLPYDTISLADVSQLIINPPNVPKKDAQWFIASSYNNSDARTHKVQLTDGSYTALVIDIDQGNLDATHIDRHIQTIIGEIAYMIYTTKSATEQNKKWRCIVPISTPLTGLEYSAYQASLFDAFQHAGVTVDRSLERPGQIIYLPNMGSYYDYRLIGVDVLNPKTHPMAKRAGDYIAIAKAQQKAINATQKEGARSYLRAFRAKHSIDELLSAYGFECHPNNPDLWRHPNQTTRHYGGLRIMRYDDSDRWVSLSDTINSFGIGKPASRQTRSGDAFDLFLYFQCNNNKDVAVHYARQCLLEEDAKRFGAATAEHGAQIWDAICRRQAEKALENAQALTETIEASEGNNDEWNLGWPPGLTGELAAYLYKGSSRPIKQFSIAAALYFMSVCGKKYNVHGQGLNLFIMLVAKTGRGKGIVKNGIDSLVKQLVEYAQNPTLALPFSHEVPVSEAGIRKALSEQNPICSYEEELGTTLLPSTKPNCSVNDLGLRKMITRTFDSGKDRVLGKKKASTDDRTKEAVEQPTFTLAGDTQPHVFNALLGSGMEDTGFPSRMVPFFYYGQRQYHNKNSSNYKQFPEQILYKLKILLEYVTNTSSIVADVQWTQEALKQHDQMDVETTDKINNKEPGTELLNRALMITARIAGIIAVGINHLNPTIDEECYSYAKQLVMRNMTDMQNILRSGGTGTGDAVRLFKIREAIKSFVTLTPESKSSSYKTPKSIVEKRQYVNERYFLIKLRGDTDFTSNGRTSEQNIREALDECIKQDILEIATDIILDKRTKQRIFQIGSGF